MEKFEGPKLGDFPDCFTLLSYSARWISLGVRSDSSGVDTILAECMKRLKIGIVHT